MEPRWEGLICLLVVSQAGEKVPMMNMREKELLLPLSLTQLRWFLIPAGSALHPASPSKPSPPGCGFCSLRFLAPPVHPFPPVCLFPATLNGVRRDLLPPRLKLDFPVLLKLLATFSFCKVFPYLPGILSLPFLLFCLHLYLPPHSTS